MAGFTIHLAIAKRYNEKHKEEIKNIDEYYKGVIAPDLDENMTGICKNKSKTHYGLWGEYQTETDISKFLQDTKVNINEDYWKGYFLHLLSDYYFYKKNFRKDYMEVIKNGEKFYYDYDCLNKILVEKYKVPILENIKKYMNFIEGEPKYLKEDKIINYIEEMSDFNIKEIAEKIKKEGMEWLNSEYKN